MSRQLRLGTSDWLCAVFVRLIFTVVVSRKYFKINGRIAQTLLRIWGVVRQSQHPPIRWRRGVYLP